MKIGKNKLNAGSEQEPRTRTCGWRSDNSPRITTTAEAKPRLLSCPRTVVRPPTTRSRAWFFRSGCVWWVVTDRVTSNSLGSHKILYGGFRTWLCAKMSISLECPLPLYGSASKHVNFRRPLQSYTPYLLPSLLFGGHIKADNS